MFDVPPPILMNGVAPRRGQATPPAPWLTAMLPIWLAVLVVIFLVISLIPHRRGRHPHVRPSWPWLWSWPTCPSTLTPSDMPTTTLPVNQAPPPAFAPIDPRPVTHATRTSRRRRTVAVVACALAVVAGLAVAMLAASGHPAIVFAFPALLIPIAIWKWDEAGVIVVLAVATLVEQIPYTVGPGVPGAFTQNIPLFHSITQGSGVNLFEVLLGLILLTWVMKGAVEARCACRIRACRAASAPSS